MINKLVKVLDRKFHIRSIQTVISLAFSVLIIFVIGIIGLLSYTITGNTVVNNSSEYVYQLVQQVNYNIENYLKNVNDIASNLQYNKNIQKYFQSDPFNNQELEDTIEEELNTIVEARTDIINILLIGDEQHIVINDPNAQLKDNIKFETQPWFINTLDSNIFAFSESHVQNLFVGQYNWVVSGSTLLKSPENHQYLGMLLIDLNYNQINDMVNKIKLGEKGYVFIIDDEGNIVYHPKQQLLYNNIKQENIDLILNSPDGNITIDEDGQQKQYTISTSNYSGWKVIGAVYIEDISSYEPYLKRFFAVVSIVSVLVAIFFAVTISRYMFYPIKDILVSMNRFKEGDLDATIEIKHDNEISEIAKAFNSMTVRIKNLVDENKENEKAKRKSELKALQAQINPHFLYNTLDSIVWMSELGNNKEVVLMTSSLAKLFRISISKGNQYITVEEELEHVKSYLTIQKVRYGEKLDYSITIDETLLQTKMVKIIIQPIVENAIYHGIKNMPGTGKIDIYVERDGGNMVIKVCDDGIGMSEETIKRIFESSSTKSSSVGVRNVDERIKINYGNSYGLKYESELYQGTVVHIILPIQTV